MPITSVELSGYKRMMLNNIQRILITFTERLQLILGTNGSGKSSLMGELNPLPADPQDFYEGGWKRTTYQIDGHEYDITSTMSHPARHSFVRDGIELNKDGLQKTQKILVQEHFKLTPELKDLVVARDKFTQMSPIERRKWFTKLSPVSYDYAIGVFMRLRDRLKGLSEAGKLTKKRLAVEAARIISAEEQAQLKADIEVLHEQIEILQANRAPLLESANYSNQQDKLLHDLEDANLRVMKLRSVLFGQVPFASLDLLDLAIQQMKEALAAARAVIDTFVKDHERLEKQFKILKETGEQGITELQQKLARKYEEQTQLLQQRSLKIDGIEPQVGQQTIDAIRDTVTDLFIDLPENSDRKFSQQAYKDDQERLQISVGMKDQQARQLIKFQTQRQQMEAHKHSEQICCPKCGHKFCFGYTEAGAQELDGKIESMREAIGRTEKEMDTVRGRLQAFEQYRDQYRRFMTLSQSAHVLKPFWDYLLAEQIVVNAPRKAQSLFEQLAEDMKVELIAQRVAKEAAELKRLIEQAASLGNENLNDVQKKLHDSEYQIQHHTVKQVELQRELEKVATLRRNLMEYLNLGDYLERTIKEIEGLTEQQVEAKRREIIHETLKRLQVQLATKTKLLAEVEAQKRTVQGLEDSIEEITVQEQATKLMLKELSPTEGLIAQGLLGSIQAFTAEMNQFIRHIWSYPLEVLPCGVADDGNAELDYYFPFLVGNEANEVSDIKYGSTGQKEIIDLAYRVVAMNRLGLVDMPLMLDEFGAGLDEEHRRSAAYAIQTLVESQRFNQVFMVSHYEASWGALTQTEVTVLCDENITVPEHFNQHVVISN